MTEAERIEKRARELRMAAFPGSRAWGICAEDVRERWLAAARLADSWIERATDDAFRRWSKHSAVTKELRLKQPARQ